MKAKDNLSDDKPSSSFIRSVGVLVGGTAFAHAITALALPVLSRLYSPADFSALAVFSSFLSIIAVAACLRFDVAVPIPRRETDAVNLLGLALGCAIAVSVLVAVPVFVVPEHIVTWLNQPALRPCLWLLPLGVLLAASYSALQGWFVRKKAFGQIARSRIVQSAASAGTQTSMGLAGIAPLGLLLGYMMNNGAACIMLGYRVLRFERMAIRAISWAGMRAMAVEYHRFPKYSTLEALSNSAAIQVPIILIAAVAVGPEAGYLTMAIYVIQAPMALFGVAIGQVYLSRAPDEYRANRLDVFTADIIGGLIRSGVGPLVFTGILSPFVFGIIFGDKWQRAGVLVSWMTPWFIMQFLSSPISMALHVTGRQREALVLQLLGFAVRLGAVVGASVFAKGAIAEAYALSGFVFYLAYMAVLMRVVAVRQSDLQPRIRGDIFIVIMWALAGGIVALTINAIHPVKL